MNHHVAAPMDVRSPSATGSHPPPDAVNAMPLVTAASDEWSSPLFLAGATAAADITSPQPSHAPPTDSSLTNVPNPFRVVAGGSAGSRKPARLGASLSGSRTELDSCVTSPNVGVGVRLPRLGCADLGSDDGADLCSPDGAAAGANGRCSSVAFNAVESLNTSPQQQSLLPGVHFSGVSSVHSAQPTPSPRGLAQIVPLLFLGSHRSVTEAVAAAVSASVTHNNAYTSPIDVFVCVAAEITNPFPQPPPEFVSVAAGGAQAPLVEEHHFALLDGAATRLADSCEEIAQLFDCSFDANKRVAVYCQMGKSRSVACVVYWLMTRQRMGFDAALTFVRAVHPRAEPNMHFINQLRDIEAAATVAAPPPLREGGISISSD